MTDLACADRTPLAGASAGSLIAACYHSGLSTETVTEACLVLADDCRVNGTRGRLGDVLSTFLHDLLPDDAHERCRDKTFVRLPFNTHAMLQTALCGQRLDSLAVIVLPCAGVSAHCAFQRAAWVANNNFW